MYDGVDKRRFRQTDVESANIGTWYRWDTKGHALAEYENDTGAFWDIGDMSMYLVPGSVLAQSKGGSPGTDPYHYHHDDASGKIVMMTNDSKEVTQRDTQAGDTEDDDGVDDGSESGEEAEEGNGGGDSDGGHGPYIPDVGDLLFPGKLCIDRSCRGKDLPDGEVIPEQPHWTPDSPMWEDMPSAPRHPRRHRPKCKSVDAVDNEQGKLKIPGGWECTYYCSDCENGGEPKLKCKHRLVHQGKPGIPREGFPGDNPSGSPDVEIPWS